MERLRAAVEAWRREESEARLARHCGADEPVSARALARRHERLQSPWAIEALSEARSFGGFSKDEEGALRAHLARAAAERALADARDRLFARVTAELRDTERSVSLPDALSRTVKGWASAQKSPFVPELARRVGELALMLAEARVLADEAARSWFGEATPHPDAGPGTDPTSAAASAFLAATDAVAREAYDGCGVGREASLEELAMALRFPELDGLFSPRDRFRRIADGFHALGFERELAARVRVESDGGGMAIRARVAPLRAPVDVRILASGVELGLGSELMAAAAVGRALGLTLISPALPVALRRPVVGTVSRALGALFAQLPAEPLFLRRARDLPARQGIRVARASATWLLAGARLAAASLIVRGSRLPFEARSELASAELSRALGARVDPALAAFLSIGPSGAGARFRGRAAGLALFIALRDRFDEDWYRNPRAAEPIRSFAERGGLLSAEAACEELGVSPSTAASRAEEMLSR